MVNVLAREIQYSPYTFVPPVLPDPILTLKNATTTAPATSTIAAVSTQEVGRFALTSSHENIRVTRLTVSAEGTFVNTLSDVVDASSVELWNADTNIQIPAIVYLTGSTVIFDNMTNDIGLDYTVNMKIVFTSVKPLDANYGNTLRFTLNTADITALSMDSLRRVILGGTTTMKQYTFGIIPPTVLLTANSPLSQNAKLATLRVTNVDSNTGITLSGITLQFQTRSIAQGGFTFSGAICLRDLGSTASCGTLGTTDPNSTDQAGGTYTMNIAASQLSNASTILTQNGGYIEYEVYLDNAPLWVAGDNANVTIKSIEYSTIN